MDFDFLIVGGGIVGLATAASLLERYPDSSLLLLEKENEVGRHQTGHNSGVIHTGIYYAPGSLKARLCAAGCRATKEFCDEEGIEYRTCGKLLVATSEQELVRLKALAVRAQENNVRATYQDAAELAKLEPNLSGLGALLIPDAGIVDYRQICRALARRIEKAGGQIRLRTQVKAIDERQGGVVVRTRDETINTRFLVVCAGLQADRLARMAGLEPGCRIVPVRGEYFAVDEAKTDIVSHLIYPVPDPELPFLGIHLTPMISGALTVGPNAVIGFAREGYRRFSFNLRDTLGLALYSGSWRLLGKYWKHALHEFRGSLFRKRYLAECRKYCASLELSDLKPWPVGIRAQAVAHDGTLIHDFVFATSPRTIHVLNAPSPAATSAMPIAAMIRDKVTAALHGHAAPNGEATNV